MTFQVQQYKKLDETAKPSLTVSNMRDLDDALTRPISVMVAQRASSKIRVVL